MAKQYRELLIAAAVGIVIVVCGGFGMFTALDARLNDSFITPKPVDPDIVIVAIDDESLQAIGQWPWDRAVFAKFINGLRPHPPKTVGLDVLFSEPSRGGKVDDDAFAKSLDMPPFPVVFAIEGNNVFVKDDFAFTTGFTDPLNIFNYAAVGSTNIILDPDGIVRRIPMQLLQGDERSEGSLAVLVAVTGDFAPPYLDEGTVHHIVYAQPTGGIRRIPFVRALEEPELLEGKIVLVGATTADLHDEQRTPVDRGTLMPGVEIQANIVNMLIKGYSLKDIPYAPLISLILALIPAAFFIRFRRSIEPLIANGIFLAIVLVVSNALFDNGIIVPAAQFVVAVLVSALVLFIYRYAKNRRDTRAMYDAFGRYVSPGVLREILRHPERIEFGGAERTVSVLFCDIRSFTTLSESMPASELVELLNRYFSVMSREVIATGGTIDKYIGDAIMAFWGAPLDDTAHAEHAVRAAIGMTKALERFNAELTSEGKIPLAIGVGIASGPAVVGNIGSLERLDYTAMGDTVNTASRLEGLTKEYKQTIIVAESTQQLLPSDIVTTPLGEASVKGKMQSVRIHAVKID